MNNIDELAGCVIKNNGILSVSMKTLKDICEIKRLGKEKVKQIEIKLESHGLGHIPKKLPTGQEPFIRLYKKGSDIGLLIDSILIPGEDNDIKIRKIIDSISSSENKIIFALLR